MKDPIEMAVTYLQQGGQKPDSRTVVSALIAAEKRSKQEKRQYQYDDLLGTWRLGFVSGTQTVRSGPNARPTKQPGKGRFLPDLLNVQITYQKSNNPSLSLLNEVDNQVTIGPLQLCLSGPTRFWPKPNALGFDFTKLTVRLGNWTPYQRAIRGGEESRQQFETASLKDQAFFTFFLVEKTHLAARGKGGGLALWTSANLSAGN